MEGTGNFLEGVSKLGAGNFSGGQVNFGPKGAGKKKTYGWEAEHCARLVSIFYECLHFENTT